MSLKFPDGLSDLDKVEFCFNVMELLRQEHNLLGACYVKSLLDVDFNKHLDDIAAAEKMSADERTEFANKINAQAPISKDAWDSYRKDTFKPKQESVSFELSKLRKSLGKAGKFKDVIDLGDL